MARDDTSDMVLAFLIGGALGVGATLLMRGEDRIDPRQLLRDAGLARRRKPLDRARDTGEEIIEVGRRAVANVREEAADIVTAARDELLHTARRSLREARRAAKRARRH